MSIQKRCGIVVISLALAAGCLSDKPGSASMASVVIYGATADAVRATTERVFADDGYHLAGQTADQMLFEREGTQRDRVLHGEYNEDLTMQVVVRFTPDRYGGTLVRADAYAQNGVGRAQKVMRVARRPYQALLDRVRASLVTVKEPGP